MSGTCVRTCPLCARCVSAFVDRCSRFSLIDVQMCPAIGFSAASPSMHVHGT